MITQRMKEIVGIMMIGEGVLAFIKPRGHTMLWRNGPAPWREMMDVFAERPGLTRCLGLTEAALGYWLATHQMPMEER